MRKAAVDSLVGLSGVLVVERDVLIAKVLDILLQQRCCWAVLGFSAPVPKGRGRAGLM